MEYQKNNKLVRQYTNQPSKFRKRNWVEINDDCWERITPIVKLNLKLQC